MYDQDKQINLCLSHWNQYGTHPKLDRTIMKTTKTWRRLSPPSQTQWIICFATFSKLENQEIARWHFEKVQKAEEDVEKIVIQSPPWKEEPAVADQCFETLQEYNKAEMSAFRLQCLHNMTHPMLTRWHWYFNIYSSPSLSIRKCFLMFGYNLWLKCLKGGGYFYMYMDRVGAWYSILIENNEGSGDLEEVSLLFIEYDGVCTIGMFASFLGAMIWLLHFDIKTQFLCKNCQLSR